MKMRKNIKCQVKEKNIGVRRRVPAMVATNHSAGNPFSYVSIQKVYYFSHNKQETKED